MGIDAASGIQKINPTDLNYAESVLLRRLLDANAKKSAKSRINIFHPNKIYKITWSLGSSTYQTTIQLSHTLVCVDHENPFTREMERYYSIFSPNQYIARGSYAFVYQVHGALLPDQFSSLIFAPNKYRVMKVQAWLPNDGKKSSNTTTCKSEGDKSDTEPERNVENESALSLSLPHLESRPVVHDNKAQMGYMELKKFTGMSLSKLLNQWQIRQPGALSEENVIRRLRLSFNLIEALSRQIHDYGIIHRDVKPENIIVDGETLAVKIFDMGLSCRDGERDNARCGSDGFAGPEAFQGKHSFKSDVYSMGIVLGLLWGGRFNRQRTVTVSRQPFVVKHPKIIDILKSLPGGSLSEQDMRDVKALISSMTADNPDDRSDVQMAMQRVDDIIVRHSLRNTPVQFQQLFRNAHELALATRAELTSEYRAFEKTTTILTDAIEQLGQDVHSACEFARTIGVKALLDQTTKMGLATVVTTTLARSQQTNAMLDRVSEEIQITLTFVEKALSSVSDNSDSRYDVFCRLTSLSKECLLLKTQLNCPSMTFDCMNKFLDDINGRVYAIETGLDNQREQLAETRKTQQELNGRLAATFERTPLGRMKANLLTALRDYTRDAGFWSNNRMASMYKQVPEARRLRDVHEILDIIDYAHDKATLCEAISRKIANLDKGGLGRSQLRDKVLPCLSDQRAVVVPASGHRLAPFNVAS